MNLIYFFVFGSPFNLISSLGTILELPSLHTLFSSSDVTLYQLGPGICQQQQHLKLGTYHTNGAQEEDFLAAQRSVFL